MQHYFRTSANLVLVIFFASLFMITEMYYLIRNRGRRGSVMQLDLRTSANLVKLIVAKLCFPSSLHQCSDATISIRLAVNILPDYFRAANILPDYVKAANILPDHFFCETFFQKVIVFYSACIPLVKSTICRDERVMQGSISELCQYICQISCLHIFLQTVEIYYYRRKDL